MNRYILKNKYPEFILLGVFAVLCVSLSIFRIGYTDKSHFIFLNWNLFLAFIPWMLTTIVIASPSIAKSNFVMFVLMGVWLLFFPNAPYILTDLFHLQYNKGIPIWFDLVLILAFAWTGLLFGFLSLLDLEKILSEKMSKFKVASLLTSLLFITGFGIYLGRYLRWNSWDVIYDPSLLLEDIAIRFLRPLDHPHTWGMTILMGIFLNMIYWSFKLLKKEDV